MKFGTIEISKLSKIAWKLPEEPPATQVLLDKLPVRVQPPSIHIGCPSWADKGFVGRIYPRGTPSKDFLKIYCKQFNTVELNTTFYHLPSARQVKKWREAATSGFRFCPKVTQSISHSRNLDTQILLLDAFIEAVLHFESALGVTFLQLPSYFQPSSMSTLQQLLRHVPKGFQLAVELRNPAWFKDKSAQQDLFSFLEEHGMIAVITDVAGRRDVLHQTLTSNCVFVRFVGNDLHSTDYTRIDSWVERLSQWLKQGLTTVYFLLHEPQKIFCVDLATYMIQQLNALEGVKILPPTPEGEQAVLFFEA